MIARRTLTAQASAVLAAAAMALALTSCGKPPAPDQTLTFSILSA